MNSIRYRKVKNFIIFECGELVVDICSILKKISK